MVPLSCNTYIYEFVPLNIVKGYIHLRIILRNHQFILKYHNINYLSPFFKRKYVSKKVAEAKICKITPTETEQKFHTEIWPKIKSKNREPV